MNRKIYRYILRGLFDLCAVCCLFLVGIGTFYYMEETFFKEERMKKEGNPGQVISGEKSGTWCTLKSNSLDGVPIYPVAGETFQTGLLPEGKCCLLRKVQEYEGEIWAQVSYCGLRGWLKKEKLHFISEKRYDIKVGDIVYMNALSEKGIYGYREPSAASEEVKDSIKYGMEFEIMELNNGWGKVKNNGIQFWINMYHMGSYPVKYWKVETLSSAAEINLREEPGEDKKSLGKVPEDTVVKIEEFEKGWGKIQYDGQEGWVMLHYLTPSGQGLSAS